MNGAILWNWFNTAFLSGNIVYDGMSSPVLAASTDHLLPYAHWAVPQSTACQVELGLFASVWQWHLPELLCKVSKPLDREWGKCICAIFTWERGTEQVVWFPAAVSNSWGGKRVFQLPSDTGLPTSWAMWGITEQRQLYKCMQTNLITINLSIFRKSLAKAGAKTCLAVIWMLQDKELFRQGIWCALKEIQESKALVRVWQRWLCLHCVISYFNSFWIHRSKHLLKDLGMILVKLTPPVQSLRIRPILASTDFIYAPFFHHNGKPSINTWDSTWI